jgi:hypothetical protein
MVIILISVTPSCRRTIYWYPLCYLLLLLMYPVVAFLLASTKVSVGSLPVVAMSPGQAKSLAASGSPAQVGTPPPVFEQGSEGCGSRITHTYFICVQKLTYKTQKLKLCSRLYMKYAEYIWHHSSLFLFWHLHNHVQTGQEMPIFGFCLFAFLVLLCLGKLLCVSGSSSSHKINQRGKWNKWKNTNLCIIFNEFLLLHCQGHLATLAECLVHTVFQTTLILCWLIWRCFH